MLSKTDLAKITNTLQIPLVIQDILDGREILDGEIQYGMHEILSNYQPDSALLCIALSAQRIAAKFEKQFANMGVLKIEAGRMIEEYAALWLDHAKERPIDNNLLMDTLVDIPDDLEAMAELLDINIAFLSRTAPEAAGLCEILSLQARAQAVIADTYIDMIERNVKEEAPVALTANSHANSNVIPFPYYARG